ncbi:hypothetical protein H0H93_013807 [Arthromyces matolae]|nr:hypothetical protein H0H93_013807 [Arthromyces matolae]
MPKLGLFSEFLDGYIGHSLPLSQPSVASSISSLFFNKPVHLVYKGPSPRLAEKTPTFPELSVTTMFQDGYPLLMLSKESMEEIEGEIRERVGTMGVGEVWKDGKVDIRRFRPNIIIEGGGPFAEDAWEEVTIGSKDAPAINLVSYCPRCLLPNVSPQTGERDKAVPYKVLSKFRAGMDPSQKLIPCVGCNGVFTGCGTVNVGDIVYVKKMLTSTPPNPV